MRKRMVTAFLAVTLLLLLSITASATDLPIDIDAVRQQEGYDDAITARFDVELFSPEAQEVSDAIAEKAQGERATAASNLFRGTYPRQAETANEQITAAADELALLSQPQNYSGQSSQSSAEELSIWVILLVAVACIGGGYALARVLMRRKKGRESGVY